MDQEKKNQTNIDENPTTSTAAAKAAASAALPFHHGSSSDKRNSTSRAVSCDPHSVAVATSQLHKLQTQSTNKFVSSSDKSISKDLSCTVVRKIINIDKIKLQQSGLDRKIAEALSKQKMTTKSSVEKTAEETVSTINPQQQLQQVSHQREHLSSKDRLLNAKKILNLKLLKKASNLPVSEPVYIISRETTTIGAPNVKKVSETVPTSTLEKAVETNMNNTIIQQSNIVSHNKKPGQQNKKLPVKLPQEIARVLNFDGANSKTIEAQTVSNNSTLPVTTGGSKSTKDHPSQQAVFEKGKDSMRNLDFNSANRKSIKAQPISNILIVPAGAGTNVAAKDQHRHQTVLEKFQAINATRSQTGIGRFQKVTKSLRQAYEDEIPKASIRKAIDNRCIPPTLNKAASNEPKCPGASPLKTSFATTSLSSETPLPAVSTFKKPFIPQKVATPLEQSNPKQQIANNLIVLEDKVLSQDEKIDLTTVFGLAETCASEKPQQMPLPKQIYIKEEKHDDMPHNLPAIGDTISTDPSKGLLVVNSTQPKKFIIAADKLKLSKEKIAALAKQIKTQVTKKTKKTYLPAIDETNNKNNYPSPNDTPENVTSKQNISSQQTLKAVQYAQNATNIDNSYTVRPIPILYGNTVVNFENSAQMLKETRPEITLMDDISTNVFIGEKPSPKEVEIKMQTTNNEVLTNTSTKIENQLNTIKGAKQNPSTSTIKPIIISNQISKPIIVTSQIPTFSVILQNQPAIVTTADKQELNASNSALDHQFDVNKKLPTKIILLKEFPKQDIKSLNTSKVSAAASVSVQNTLSHLAAAGMKSAETNKNEGNQMAQNVVSPVEKTKTESLNLNINEENKTNLIEKPTTSSKIIQSSKRKESGVCVINENIPDSDLSAVDFIASLTASSSFNEDYNLELSAEERNLNASLTISSKEKMLLDNVMLVENVLPQSKNINDCDGTSLIGQMFNNENLKDLSENEKGSAFRDNMEHMENTNHTSVNKVQKTNVDCERQIFEADNKPTDTEQLNFEEMLNQIQNVKETSNIRDESNNSIVSEYTSNQNKTNNVPDTQNIECTQYKNEITEQMLTQTDNVILNQLPQQNLAIETSQEERSKTMKKLREDISELIKEKKSLIVDIKHHLIESKERTNTNEESSNSKRQPLRLKKGKINLVQRNKNKEQLKIANAEKDLNTDVISVSITKAKPNETITQLKKELSMKTLAADIFPDESKKISKQETVEFEFQDVIETLSEKEKESLEEPKEQKTKETDTAKVLVSLIQPPDDNKEEILKPATNPFKRQYLETIGQRVTKGIKGLLNQIEPVKQKETNNSVSIDDAKLNQQKLTNSIYQCSQQEVKSAEVIENIQNATELHAIEIAVKGPKNQSINEPNSIAKINETSNTNLTKEISHSVHNSNKKISTNDFDENLIKKSYENDDENTFNNSKSELLISEEKLHIIAENKINVESRTELETSNVLSTNETNHTTICVKSTEVHEDKEIIYETKSSMNSCIINEKEITETSIDSEKSKEILANQDNRNKDYCHNYEMETQAEKKSLNTVRENSIPEDNTNNNIAATLHSKTTMKLQDKIKKHRHISNISNTDTQSDIDITDLDGSVIESNDETAKESSQEQCTMRTSRKRLRKTVDDVKKGRRVNTESDTDEEHLCSNPDSNEFLGFDEALPNSSKMEEKLKILIAATSAEEEEDDSKEEQNKTKDKKVADGRSTNKRMSSLKKNSVINKFVESKKSAPSLVLAANSMPPKKRWEFAHKPSNAETDITDDTSPAQDDDDDDNDGNDASCSKKTKNIPKVGQKRSYDESQPSNHTPTVKKTKLSTDNETKDYVFVEPQPLKTIKTSPVGTPEKEFMSYNEAENSIADVSNSVEETSTKIKEKRRGRPSKKLLEAKRDEFILSKTFNVSLAAIENDISEKASKNTSALIATTRGKVASDSKKRESKSDNTVIASKLVILSAETKANSSEKKLSSKTRSRRPKESGDSEMNKKEANVELNSEERHYNKEPKSIIEIFTTNVKESSSSKESVTDHQQHMPSFISNEVLQTTKDVIGENSISVPNDEFELLSPVASKRKCERKSKLNKSISTIETRVDTPIEKKRSGRQPKTTLLKATDLEQKTEPDISGTHSIVSTDEFIKDTKTLLVEKKKPGRKPKLSVEGKNISKTLVVKKKKPGRKQKLLQSLESTKGTNSQSVEKKKPGRKRLYFITAEDGTNLLEIPEVFNMRLLLVRSRSQLETNEKLTANDGQPAAGFVKCGFCLVNLKEGKWIEHLGEHYGVGWIDGEPALDVNNRFVVLNAIKNYFKRTKVKGLYCRLCKNLYRSALGLLTHVESCCITVEEQQKNRISCSFCKNSFSKLTMPMHIRICTVRLEAEKARSAVSTEEVTTEEILNNVGRVKRASLMKAEDIIKKIGEELKTSDTKDFDPNKFIKLVEPLTKTDWQSKCKSDMNTFGKMFCPQKLCKFVCTDLAEIEGHFNECKYVPKVGYHCTICNKAMSVFNTKEKALRHVNKIHRPRDANDFEGDSTDCDLENVSTDTDDSCSSGVDSNEENSIAQEDEESNEAANNTGRKKRLQKNKKWCKRKPPQGQDKLQPIFPARHVNIDTNVINSWKEFTSQNYAKDNTTFDHFVPTYNLYESSEVEKAWPRQNESMKFSFAGLKSIEDSFGMPASESVDWLQLKPSETYSQEDDYLTFIGGPIRALSWVPLPVGCNTEDQYLAICYSKDLNKFTRFSSPKIEPTNILIYKINIKAANDKDKIKLHYAIHVADGPVHCLEFLPSGGYAPAYNRMGLLAVGTACNNIKVYSLPIEIADSTKMQENNLVINLKPAFVLSLDLNTTVPETSTETQCLRIKWSEFREHNLIFAGFSNGFVGTWDINDDENENLNRFIVDDVRYYVPLNYLYCGNKIILDMALHYDTNGPRWLAILANIRTLLVLDLCDLTNPLIIRNEILKNSTSAIDWPIIWENIAMSVGSAIPNSSEAVVIKSTIGLQFIHSKTLLVPGGATQAKFNPWNSLYASTSENGELYFHKMREMHFEMHDFKSKNFTKAAATIDVKCLNGEKIENMLKTENWQMFECHYKEKYGLIFTCLDKVPGCDNFAQKHKPPINIARYMRINYISWNLNSNGRNLLACGYENGFLRILNLKVSKYFDSVKKLLEV